MYRRDFLKGTGAGAAAASLVAGSAVSLAGQTSRISNSPTEAGALELNVSIDWAPAAQGLADQAWQIAQKIEAATSGSVRLKLDYNSEETRAPVLRTQADAVMASDNGNFAVHPAFSFFAGLPGNMGLPFSSFDAWLTAGGGQDLWDELAAQFGWKPLLASHSGVGGGLWSAEPINTIQDAAGKTFAVDGLSLDVARGLGTNPVAGSQSSIKVGLTNGTIDAIEPASPTEAIALGIPQNAKTCMHGGLQPRGSTVAIYIRSTVWDKLSAAQQLAITAAVGTEARNTAVLNTANDAMIKAMLAQVHGVNFMPMADELRVAIDRISEAIVADLASRDAFARKIAGSIAVFAATPVVTS